MTIQFVGAGNDGMYTSSHYWLFRLGDDILPSYVGGTPSPCPLKDALVIDFFFGAGQFQAGP